MSKDTAKELAKEAVRMATRLEEMLEEVEAARTEHPATWQQGNYNRVALELKVGAIVLVRLTEVLREVGTPPPGK